MLEFKEITLKNFSSYGNNETTLNLENFNGISAVCGENGVGKSSAFESVIFTLFGKNRYDSVDDIVNRQIGKNCKTSVTIQINEDTYKFLRYRNHDTHKNNLYVFKNNEDISCKNVNDTQQLILDIIKMDYTGFTNSTFFSTETYKQFLRARNSERLNIFNSLLSLHETNAIYDIAKKKSNKLKDQIKELETRLAVAQNNVDSTEASSLEYKQKAKETLLNFKNEKEELEVKIKFLKRDLEAFEHINVDEEKKKFEDYRKKQEIEKKIQDLRFNYRFIEPLDEETIDLATKFEGIDWAKKIREYEEYKESVDRYNELGEKVYRQELEHGNLYEEIERLKEEIENFEFKKEKVQKRLETLSGSICPECSQPINKQEENRQRHALKDEIKDCDKYIENLTNLLADNEKKYVVSKDYLDELRDKKEKCKVEKNLFLTDPSIMKNKCEIAYEKVKNYKELSKIADEENEKITNEMQTLEKQIKDIESPKYRLEDLEDFDGKITSLNKKIEDAEKHIVKINAMASSVYDKDYVESLEKKIQISREEVDKIKRCMDSVIDDNKYYTFIADCFSNKSNSFKKYFIGEMIDVCNNKINQFLPFLFSDNISINFDRDLNETIVYNDDKITFASLSSGQKARCELAIAFALFSLARIFFSNDMNLLIVDELLDSNLDFIGTRNAVTLLEGLAKDTKIFIITHNSNITESIENIILVRQDDNGFSTLSY